jgi:FkbM family methyltransferase
MKILYGTLSCNIDVTEVCYKKLLQDNIITIPNNDAVRASIFSDPAYGVVKTIFVYLDEQDMREFSQSIQLRINITDNTIQPVDCYDTLQKIHSKLQIIGGYFIHELEEQLMSVNYLKGDEKVLEIGGNIGRNSMVIASLLGENQNNLVVLETDEKNASILRQNRELNNMNFHIEISALSKRKLIQKGWDTIPSEKLLDGYKWVNTITLKELRDKYNIQFNTLVLDCEGAFYYILLDMPDVLHHIQLIIMENDYQDILHKKYIDGILTNHQFIRTYVSKGGWGPCYDCFYEVWRRS